MILDLDYNRGASKLTISYINERGNKSFLETNIKRFKSWCFDRDGEDVNWDGRKCTMMYTDRPSKFDIKYYINEMSKERKDMIFQKHFPKLYTFDIEIDYDPTVKLDPSTAKFPITTISICSPSMTTIVLGTGDIKDESKIKERYTEYLNNLKIVKDNNLQLDFIYKKFNSEGEMLLYFLKNIVAKCSVLAGWNIFGFDWHYIQSRLTNYYPEISIRNSSPVFRTKNKKVPGFFNKDESINLQVPQHVLLVDMMDVIMTHDYVVLPTKESASLDWIAKASIGAQKVEYEGTLAELYKNDYDTYVLYNAIDSALVQLIDKHFKTMQTMYIFANITKLDIDSCFRKIPVAEALFFEDFYNHNKKVVKEDTRNRDRGTLVGAYVKQPSPGRYNNVMCFDFAGLYPSQVITCNLSVENFIQPPLGGWDERTLEDYRMNSDYFVSVNKNVYRNDQDYAFRRIQVLLKNNRNLTKYLAKDLNAQVMSIVDDVLTNHVKGKYNKFSESVEEYMIKTYKLSCPKDIIDMEDIKEFKLILNNDIQYKIGEEQAFKLVGNSCYGGSSHPGFFWFNIDMANDITGESRNLIHMMEKLTDKVFKEDFLSMVDLHKELGVTLDESIYKHVIDSVLTTYQDTDSSYINVGPVINSIVGVEKMTDHDKAEFCVNLANLYLNPLFNSTLDRYFRGRNVKSVHNFELETVAKTGVWINVKKRYAQSLVWQDGRYFDEPKIKVKGLEIIKSSYPAHSRNTLKEMMNVLLLDESDDMTLIHKLNKISQRALADARTLNMDEVCESANVNGYGKNIINDSSGLYPECAKGASYGVKALALYNWLINTKGYTEDNVYGGKMKLYIINDKKLKKKSGSVDRYFAYTASNYPKWASTEAPISYSGMHEKTVLNPINRILEAINMKTLKIDGSITTDLFV